MPKKNKLYSLNQSPLYKLHSRKKLARLLGIAVNKLERLANSSNNYHVISKVINTKTRQLELPKSRLQQIHFRLFRLLQRIEPPDYLHSGVRGKSYITNAQQHIGAPRLLKLDIEKFFPSTRRGYIYHFFSNFLECSADVSAVLAKISTYKGYVPTGSCLSQIIAFYAHLDMFSRIDKVAEDHNLVMTCYVDDITISGQHINKQLLIEIRRILKTHNLKSNITKERLYLNSQPREVTGLIVTKNGLLLPNKKHKDIYDSFMHLPSLEDTPNKLAYIESLIGKVITASQVDNHILRFLKPLQYEALRLQYIKPAQSFTLA